MAKTRVGKISEIGANNMMGAEVKGKFVLIAKVEGKYFGMQGKCSHAGGNLWEGKLEGFVVKCPRHGSEFDVRTGKVLKGPWVPFGKAKDLPTYSVIVEGDELSAELPD
jgi:3-phenylpropionate/trans-cinnamate dioxygenase ferredoxin component